MITLYVPVGICGTVNIPSSELVVVLSRPVALFFTVMLAFATTAPCRSFTVPVIDPTVDICATAVRHEIAKMSERKRNLGRCFFIEGAPPRVVNLLNQRNGQAEVTNFLAVANAKSRLGADNEREKLRRN